MLTKRTPKSRDTGTGPLRLYTFVNFYFSSIQQGIQSAHVVQDDVIAEILSIMNGPATCGIVDHVPVTRNDIFAKKWLDVEPIFEKAGWEVSYDSPVYCENYRAYFIFKQK